MDCKDYNTVMVCRNVISAHTQSEIVTNGCTTVTTACDIGLYKTYRSNFQHELS